MAFPAARNIKRSLERGMSLFETLLAVGVTAVFFVFLINLGSVIAREQAIQAAAAYVAQLDKAVTQTLDDPSRFGQLYTVLLATGGQAQATVANLRDGTGILDPLPPSPLLNNTFPDPGPMNQTYRVLFRIGDNVGNPNDNRVIESYVASQTLIEDDMAMRISGALGGRGGALRDTANVAVGNIRGAFGNWTIPTASLAATGWFTTVSTAVDQPTLDNGGYVVAYHYFDEQRIAKDYLYRTAMPGDPRLNRMESDLDMNGYNILGADNIATAGSIVSNEVFVNGNARITTLTTIRPTTVAGQRVGGNLQADGTSSATGQLFSSSNLAVTAPNGRLNSGSATVRNNALFGNSWTVNGRITSTELSARTGEINGGSLVATGVPRVNAGTTAAGLQVTNGTTVTGNVRTSRLDSSNMNIPNGATGMIFMQAQNNYNHVAGSTTGLNNGSVPYYSANGLTRLQGNRDWRCINGCGD